MLKNNDSNKRSSKQEAKQILLRGVAPYSSAFSVLRNNWRSVVNTTCKSPWCITYCICITVLLSLSLATVAAEPPPRSRDDSYLAAAREGEQKRSERRKKMKKYIYYVTGTKNKIET